MSATAMSNLKAQDVRNEVIGILLGRGESVDRVVKKAEPIVAYILGEEAQSNTTSHESVTDEICPSCGKEFLVIKDSGSVFCNNCDHKEK